MNDRSGCVTDVEVFVLVLKIVDVVFETISTDVLKTVTEIEQIPLDVDKAFDELLLLLNLLDDGLNEE
jgi:hypothetical protein